MAIDIYSVHWSALGSIIDCKQKNFMKLLSALCEKEQDKINGLCCK